MPHIICVYIRCPHKVSQSVYTYFIKFWVGIHLKRVGVADLSLFQFISRQTSKGDIPTTFVTNKTNLRGNFELNSNLIQSHLRL